MDEEQIALVVISAILGVAAIILFIVAYRHHKERGAIFTNEWLWASKQEREKMDERVKKAEYRVGRNVFFMLGILSLLFAVNFLLWISWLFYVCYAIMGLLVVYAIYQYIKNEKYYVSIGYRK